MPKESLKQKRKAPVIITQAPTEQDEETTSRLVFKEKGKLLLPLLSTLTQMVEPHFKTPLTQMVMLHPKM